MPITTTIAIICDHCGRGPRSGDRLDEGYYGWMALKVEHLTNTGMGHNEIDFVPTKVFCSECGAKLRQAMQDLVLVRK